VIATIGDKAGENLIFTYKSTEFGAPNGKAPPKLADLAGAAGSLGGVDRRT
jgi:hypothetical protein